MRIDRIIIYLLCTAAAALALLRPPLLHARDSVEIREVALSGATGTIRVRLNGEAPYRVMRIDKREVMIAFRNATIAFDLKERGSGRPVISRVDLETPRDDLTTLIVETRNTVKSVSDRWLDDENTLVVTVVTGEDGARDEKTVRTSPERESSTRRSKSEGSSKPKPRPVVKVKPGDRDAGKKAGGAEKAPVRRGVKVGHGVPVISVPPVVPAEEGPGGSGTAHDLLLEIAEDPCFRSGELAEVPALTSAKEWGEAYERCDQYLAKGENPECGAVVSLLAAYLFHMKERREDPSRYLEEAEMLRDVHAFAPESKYTPYNLTLLGNALMKLGSRDEAKGYYKIVMDSYKQYPGMPEILYNMGVFRNEAGDTKEAMALLSRVVNEFPHSEFVTDARIALGKALFNKHRYIDALSILTEVLKNKPEKAYENPDLLLLTGNAYYTIGKTLESRDPLVKAYNFFPDIEARDVILTKIGDSYIDSDEKRKAIKIYRLVTEKYPGSEGFVISSMRLAEHLEDPDEKASLYEMVKNDYPDNPLSKLAMMRLAQLRHGGGEFEGSIDIIKELLASRPGVLKKEALYLLRDSFEELFQRFLREDDYPEALSRFESERGLVDNLENPEIFLLVGTAYLKGHIYDRARDMLQKAYDLYDKRKRPESLVHGFGTALHETGKGEEAKRILGEYVKLFPKGAWVVDAFWRMGRIRMSAKEPEQALGRFRQAYGESSDNVEKAKILFDEVTAETALGRRDEVNALLVRAIEHLAVDPEANFNEIYNAYQLLGENHFELGAYGDAVDAFTMAIKFADRTRNNSDIYFRLAESYHKGKVLDKARESYREVVKMEEPFWVKLAEERLKVMDLAEKLKES